MTTILDLTQQALSAIGAEYPTTLLSTSVQQQNQLRAVIYDEARFLRNQRIFPQSKKSYSFVTQSGRSKYPLPTDFFSALLRTQWDQTNHWEMRGPMSDQGWNYRTYGIVNFDNKTAYKIFGPDGNPNTIGGQFNVSPTPGTPAGLTLGFDYITKNLFLPPYWSPSTVVAASSYRSASGNIYFTTLGGTTGLTPPSATSAVPADGTISDWTYISAPYETIIKDTDMSIFDDDLMVAGIKWRYLRAKKQSCDTEFAEHQALVGSAKSRWIGDFSISLGAADYRFPYANVPEGSWNI